MLRLAVYCYLEMNDNQRAPAFDEALRQKGNMTADDHGRSGLIKLRNSNYKGAAKDFRKALQIDPQNKYAEEQLNLVNQKTESSVVI